MTDQPLTRERIEQIEKLHARLLEKFGGDGFTGGVNKRKLDGAFVAHCVDCLNDHDEQHDEDCAFPMLKEAADIIRELLAQVQRDGWRSIDDGPDGAGGQVWVAYPNPHHPDGWNLRVQWTPIQSEHAVEPLYWCPVVCPKPPLPLPPADGRDGR